MKTARFSEVVARSGTPKIHLTWTAPVSDRVLQSAAKEKRILTVHQQVRGAKKDFGMIGVEAGPDVQFLVFPKTLRSFEGQRVVGINYELLGDALSIGTKPQAPAAPVAKPKPKLSRVKNPAPQNSKRAKPVATRVLNRDRDPTPEPIVFEPAKEDDDPMKTGIRRALTDLSMGNVTKAKRRLTALLQG